MRSSTARSFWCCPALVLLVAASTAFGCATGSTTEVQGPPGSDDTGGGVGDVSGGETSGDETSGDAGGVDSSGGDGSGGDSSIVDTGADMGPVTDGDTSVCDPTLTISCGVGECTVTIPACTEAGLPATCKPKDPKAEICNGKDDDCDGLIDEDLGETTCGVGECKRVQKNCVDGAPKTCMPGTPGVPECNGKDNDCDGTIDSDFGTTTCGVGECKVTQDNCVGGVKKTCTPKPPGIAVCNGKDNDCDGKIDTDFGTTTCGTGVCAVTITNCIAGVPQVCMPSGGGAILTCGLGECVNSTPSCIAGVPQVCTPKPGGVETCDGKDNDCNGITDDGPSTTLCPPPPNTSDTACTGGKCRTTVCDSGWVDVNGTFADGCECADSDTPHSCAASAGSVSDVGTVGLGSVKSFTSNGPVIGRDDWIKVVFLNTKSDKLAHPKITFTTNPSTVFQFEVVYGSCGGTTPVCASGPATATAKTTWESSYLGSATGLPTDITWVPILSAVPVTSGAYNPTTSNHGTIFVRVFYKAGVSVPTCLPYTLSFSN